MAKRDGYSSQEIAWGKADAESQYEPQSLGLQLMNKRIVPDLLTRCTIEAPVDEAPARLRSSGTLSEPKDSKTSDAILKEIIDLHKRYSDEVWKSENLAIYSKALYIDMANNFVRWIQGEFKPGGAGLKLRRRGR